MNTPFIDAAAAADYEAQHYITIQLINSLLPSDII